MAIALAVCDTCSPAQRERGVKEPVYVKSCKRDNKLSHAMDASTLSKLYSRASELRLPGSRLALIA